MRTSVLAAKLITLRTRSLTIPLLAEKAITSTKPVTKQKSLEAILLYIELDKAEPVIEELVPLLSHKLPKVVAGTLSAITAIVHAYGCKTVEPKPILKLLPKAYGHADKTVRAEAQKLTVELYRWLRDGMKPLFWDDLKPVQQQDLEKLLEPVKEEAAPKPERLLKSQQAAVAASAAATEAEGEDDVGEDEAEVDLEPELLTVDIMPKVPKDLHERLASSKWKDRKEALDDLHVAVNCPAIEEGPFDEIVRALAKCMKDANIAVVTVAANCVELLARGLRRGFSKYRSTIVSPIMERLKERKQSVTDALGAALDSVCAATSLMECLEETLEFLKHKNPLVKLEATRFLIRSLRATREAPGLPEVKVMSEAAKGLLADSQETQRNAAAEVLGTLLKIMGERIMNTHFEGLDDIRKAKIKEFCESAEVKTVYKPKTAAPAKAPSVAAQGSKKPPAKKVAPATSTVKKTAPVALDEAPPAALQPKLSSRPAVTKPNTSTAARSLKPSTGGMVKKVQSSGYGQTSAAATASPRRTTDSPAPSDDTMTIPKLPRSLTGRQLSKPPTMPLEPIVITSNLPTTSALSAAERIELDDLRMEVERLRSTNESLRAEHVRFSSQIHELQYQSDQLIEEHTRDMLSVKAKETQLVRARAETEQAEQTSQQLQLEVDRLRRELNRVSRSLSPQDYAPRDPYAESARAGVPASVGSSARANVLTPSSGSSSSEGKENRDLDPGHPAADKTRQMLSPRLAGLRAKAASPARLPEPAATSRLTRPLASHTVQSASSQYGNGDAASRSALRSPPAGTPLGAFGSGIPRSASSSAGVGDSGAESWKRAAEVTQNLKARIELMKVSTPEESPSRCLPRLANNLQARQGLSRRDGHA